MAFKTVKQDSYDSVFKNPANPRNRSLAALRMSASKGVDMYLTDNMAARIVDVIPEEMVSPGFNIDGLDDELSFRSFWDEKRFSEKVTDALKWARLYGGSAIVAIVRDGRMLRSPVAEGATIEDVRVYDRNQVRVGDLETNPRNVNYGKPKTYIINPGGQLQEYEVHASRVCVINGKSVPNSVKQSNDGWGASVLTRSLIDAIEDYNRCHNLATRLLARKQQGVWKARGLSQLCDDTEGEYAARIRLAQIDDNSGVESAIGIDAEDEDYVVLNSDLSGVKDLLDKKIDRIVELTGIHEIILKNKNTGGVSASQNTALETFYKMIERERQDKLKPILEFLIKFILVDNDTWSVSFNSLNVPSEKESAEIMDKRIAALDKAFTSQVIDMHEYRDTIRAIIPDIKIGETDELDFPDESEKEAVDKEKSELDKAEKDNQNDQ